MTGIGSYRLRSKDGIGGLSLVHMQFDFQFADPKAVRNICARQYQIDCLPLLHCYFSRFE